MTEVTLPSLFVMAAVATVEDLVSVDFIFVFSIKYDKPIKSTPIDYHMHILSDV